MWLEGYCFLAGMSVALVILPVLGIWGEYQQNERRQSFMGCGKKEQEKLEEQENHNRFNSITQKSEPENQNQEHNARKEGISSMSRK